MNIGDKFPDLLGKDADGKEVRLSDYPGKNFIIYFYPKDNTPGCTAEACNFRDKFGLQFPLVADTETTLCQLAGVWQKKKMAGREYMGIVRTTFVTDNTGTVTDKVVKVQTKTASEQLFELLDNRNDINPA